MLCKSFRYRDSVNWYDVELLLTNCLFSLCWCGVTGVEDGRGGNTPLQQTPFLFFVKRRLLSQASPQLLINKMRMLDFNDIWPQVGFYVSPWYNVPLSSSFL